MSEQDRPHDSQSAPLPSVARRRWITLLLTLVVFASGLVIGSGLTFMYIERQRAHYLAHPEEIPKRFADRLQGELGLSDEQARQVQAIVADRWPRFQQTRREVYPVLRQHLDAIHADVGAILRSEQVKKWDEYVERIHQMWNPPPSTSAPADDAPAAPADPPKTGGDRSSGGA